jgi:hypothetical protein
VLLKDLAFIFNNLDKSFSVSGALLPLISFHKFLSVSTLLILFFSASTAFLWKRDKSEVPFLVLILQTLYS